MKTATLLALLPVAAYFILPLIWKQIPGSKESSSQQASFVVPTAIAGSGSMAATPQTALQTLQHWQEIAAWIAKDARMKSADAPDSRNPFQRATKVASVEAPPEQKGNEQNLMPPKLRPEEFGLQLTVTIIGPAKRMATINGRLYPENATIKVNHGEGSETANATTDQSFVLKTVAKSHVMLERDGQLYRLSLAGNQPN